MLKVLIVYYSKSGNTAKMADMIAAGVKEEGLKCDVKKVQDIKAEDLLDYDGIIMGSPTYYGSMAAELKALIDQSVSFHGKMDGVAGSAFSSAANIGGGNETTILNMINAMLIHGMVVQGNPVGDHYGTVAIGAPDARDKKQCPEQGRRFARLVKKLKKANRE